MYSVKTEIGGIILINQNSNLPNTDRHLFPKSIIEAFENVIMFGRPIYLYYNQF